MTNINLGAMSIQNERFWVHGPSWELTHVPAGFSHSVVVVTGQDGIRPTLQRWGEFLLTEHHTTRLHDPSLEYLGVNARAQHLHYYHIGRAVVYCCVAMQCLSRGLMLPYVSICVLRRVHRQRRVL